MLGKQPKTGRVIGTLLDNVVIEIEVIGFGESERISRVNFTDFERKKLTC